jgi:signal transduction histidine kinase
MNLFSGRIKEIGIISIILIIALSYGIFFYLQSITEHNIRDSIFEQQKRSQIQATDEMSDHIGSDLSLIVGMLGSLADSIYLQQEDLTGGEAKKLMKEKYIQFNTIIDTLFILDKNNIMVFDLAPPGSETFLGIDFSYRDWVKDTKNNLAPAFSGGLERQGIYRIFITYPIINQDTGKYVGLIGVSVPTIPFFAHYGNVRNINSQFLVVFDRNATILAVGANQSLVGKNFFGDYTQQFINHNKILNDLTRNMLAGYPSYAVYDYGKGERLTTASPIFVNYKPVYFIQVVTPTSQIYSQINNILFTEREKMFSFLAGITAAVVVLIIFLIKWNSSLNNEVKRRTKELDESNQQLQLTTAELKKANESLIESNKKLELANKQLEFHDTVQREFINVAAHELRTPIQPILALTGILRSKINDTEQRQFLDIVFRNAKRLHRLTDDILDVTRIESQLLYLKKEHLNLNDIIINAINDIIIDKGLENNNNKKNLKIRYDPRDIFIKADRYRLSQVISNLLTNAVKFTEEGTISITIEKKETSNNNNNGNGAAVVSIKDTGTGIDPDIMPRLFTKFATKSFEGTGLGLFISKNIIEAHGGSIWAENNSDGEKGATFSFAIPIANKEKEEEEQQQLQQSSTSR